jgi:hypothetical protein
VWCTLEAVKAGCSPACFRISPVPPPTTAILTCECTHGGAVMWRGTCSCRGMLNEHNRS